MRLAHAEPAVQIDAHAGQHLAAAEQLLPAGPALFGRAAELLTRLQRGGLAGLGRVGTVGRKAHIGKCWERPQLADEPFR